MKRKVFADYIKLTQKHFEYFAHSRETKAMVEFILQNPSEAIKASKKNMSLFLLTSKAVKGFWL